MHIDLARVVNCWCRHDNGSHDPLVGCLFPDCRCPVRCPAAEYPPVSETVAKARLRAERAAAAARLAVVASTPRGRIYRSKARARRHRRLRAFLESPAGVLLACLLLVAVVIWALATLALMGPGM